MANNTQTVTKAAAEPMPKMAVAAPLLGWILPGAGHLIQKRYVRGVLLMASMVMLFVFGLAMEGKIYAFNMGDLLDILGFFGDIGNGGLYVVARMMDLGHGAIHRATADYGTKFLIISGLLNIISVVDAYHIAIGKKK